MSVDKQPAARPLSPSCETCALSGVCLPIAIDESNLARLDEIVERGRPLRKGAHVFRAGEPFTSVFAVRAGTIKTYRITEDGEEQIMGFHLPGEVFGFAAIGTGTYRNSAVALESAAVCEIPFERLEELGHEIPSLQRHFVSLMAREITEDQDLLILLSKKTAEQRLASFLLALSSRLRRRGLSGTEFRLPMSRSEIGNYLGLVIETVSRILGRFQRDAILRVDGREVVILEPAQLSAKAVP